jgi:3-phosphoshikimate 1-carboxyvinyltransferase
MEPTGMHYAAQIEIEVLARPPSVAVDVPGSKSITNRALVLATLSGRACVLQGALQSEDTEIMVACLQALGFRLQADWSRQCIVVGSRPGTAVIPAAEADLFVGNSGTTMRFLTAILALGHGTYRLDGVSRMRERPIGDLLEALAQLGVRASSENGNACPPVCVEAAGLRGGRVVVKGDVSSQFLSGLMLAGPLAESDLHLVCTGRRVSWPYVTLTAAMLGQFGAQVIEVPEGFVVAAPRPFGIGDYAIEPDASAASYFFAAAAITGGRVTVGGLSGPSLQGDLAFVDLLEHMGCRVERCSSGITVHGKPLRGIDTDMNAVSDTVMSLAACACFAEGPTTIRNVAHIRHKETDRLSAMATELRRVGAGVEERADGLRIVPGPLHGAAIRTYRDHRIAMSMALIGLRVPGIVIEDPACVAKTYPGFFDDLDRLRS